MSLSSGPRRARFSSIVALAGLLACPTTGALAQTCTFPPASPPVPDVICGDVTSPANYPHTTTMDAIALGTTSCNIGNTTLNWFSNTVNHPLMGGQVYKYKIVNGSGRFESIGQSWLKHAFTALQGQVCCMNCTPSGTGTLLGIGCSDPYGGGLNGSQNSLGPKYQVNPHTGTYIASPPHPSGGNNGRIQMSMTDLEVSSTSMTNPVRYFGEMTYVALDDARGNNSDNNISWRELSATFPGSTAGYTFGNIGATVRMQAGIHAWKLVDPAVTITTISVPEGTAAPYDGEAKVYLGSRVTDLGGGVWHYEYALYNQNSDRAIGSFSVPCPAGNTVTNIGFRDVAYIGGDGIGGVDQDGTDWPGMFSAGSVAWATIPFGTNPNSNALRWETTYNFRFDSNAPPVSGSVTFGQYKVLNNIVVPNIQVPGNAPTFRSMCSNDTLGTDHTSVCPCANIGGSGNGCAHSVSPAGARLQAFGLAAADNVQLDATGMPSAAFTLFMQHDAAGDQVFHDGVLCADGNLIRLRGRNAAGGASLFPDPSFPNDATLTLSQRGSVTVGSGARRYYSAFFRNASTTFCPPATANVTNGWVIDW